MRPAINATGTDSALRVGCVPTHPAALGVNPAIGTGLQRDAQETTMPKRRYINARHYLDRIYARQAEIRARQSELMDEFVRLHAAGIALEDRADALIAYDWQSRHQFPLIAEMSDV